MGFKFPAIYKGKPSFFDVQIYENGKTHNGNSDELKKFFPILPFAYSGISQGDPFVLQYDKYYENNEVQFILKDPFKASFNWFNSTNFFDYSLQDSLLKLRLPLTNQFVDQPLAFGNFEGLYYYDNFVFEDGNYYKIFQTKYPISPNEFMSYFSENYKPNQLAIAHYLINIPLQKKN